MSQTLIEQYDARLQESKFAELVASIVVAKLSGKYTNIEPNVIGGWYISMDDQATIKAEGIADAVVDGLGI